MCFFCTRNHSDGLVVSADERLSVCSWEHKRSAAALPIHTSASSRPEDPSLAIAKGPYVCPCARAYVCVVSGEVSSTCRASDEALGMGEQDGSIIGRNVMLGVM